MKTQKKVTIFGYEDLSGEAASGEDAISKHMVGKSSDIPASTDTRASALNTTITTTPA